jgi:FMN-dependent oxidoreductase (nitrilotriacetate monooxygenase family)
MKRRAMHFGVFVLGTGNHSAGWRHDGAAISNNDLSVIREIARHAERGKFDLLFVSDGLVMDPGDHPSFLCRFEPTTLISALSASTRHIGLGATVSTSFGEPYHVARTFASIAHITGGRAAWNVVTSSAGKAALNFSREAHLEHDLRYEVAQEFVDVVKGLWDCWEDGAIVADRATGVYIDPSKVRPLDHRGRFFQVKGPVNMARCPQGHPVVIQAGGSEAGLELAARTADVVFSVVQELSAARRAYRDLKGRMAKYGRTPDQITAHADQRPHAGDQPDRVRRDRLSPRRARAGSPGRREQPDLLACPLRDGATGEHDSSRSLQPHGGRPRPLGPVRDSQAHRRHAGRMVRRGSRGRLQRPSPLLPGRARRLRRPGRAGASGARIVPA